MGRPAQDDAKLWNVIAGVVQCVHEGDAVERNWAPLDRLLLWMQGTVTDVGQRPNLPVAPLTFLRAPNTLLTGGGIQLQPTASMQAIA